MALVYKDITIDVNPGKAPQTIHVSQYDINRQFNVTLTDDGTPLNIPTGVTAVVEGSIGRYSFRENANISNNVVTFLLSEAMTANKGKVWTKIKLTEQGHPLSTCAFWLDVDRAGVEAEMVIGATGFEKQLQTAFENYLEKYGTAPVGSGVSSVNGKSGVVALKTSDLPNDAGYLTADNDVADVWFLDNLDTATKSLGDCTVIRAGGKVGILDFGGDQTGNAILDFLESKDIRNVDFLIITHYHIDHIGGGSGAGLSALLHNSRGITFENCVAYLPHGQIDWSAGHWDFDRTAVQANIKSWFNDAGISIIEPVEGQEVALSDTAKLVFRNLSLAKFAVYYDNYEYGDVDDLTATIPNTDPAKTYGETNSYNNFSMIVELHHYGNVFLFAADAERPMQAENADEISAPTVYKAEHHALNFTTDSAWLSKIHPEVCVIMEYPSSTGYPQRRLAAPTVMQSYESGVVYDTLYSGLVSIQSTAMGIAHKTETGVSYEAHSPVFSKLIPEGANLNDFLTPGLYYSSNAKHTATLSGLPDGMVGAFALAVLQGSGKAGYAVFQVLYQTFKKASAYPAIYMRGYDDTAGANCLSDWSRYSPDGTSPYDDLAQFTKPVFDSNVVNRTYYVEGGYRVVGQVVYVYLVVTTTDYAFAPGNWKIASIPKAKMFTPLITAARNDAASAKLHSASVNTTGDLYITFSDSIDTTNTATIVISGEYPLGSST